MLGEVEFTSVAPSFLAQKELLGGEILDPHVVSKVSIRAAKVFGGGCTFPQTCGASPCITDENAILQIDIGLRDVVVVADLLPHTSSRLSKDIVLGRRVDAGRKVEAIEDGATLLLELGNSFLGVAFGALVLCVKV